MKKNDIKERKQEIEKIMKEEDFKIYFEKHHECHRTKKNTFKKLVKKVSKKYNTIVVLNRDMVLIHDVKKNLYELTKYKNLNKNYENIFIENDTVVLIHSLRSNEFLNTDCFSLYNNFIYKDKYHTKVLFYEIIERSDSVFKPYIPVKDYHTHNQNVYASEPELLEKLILYKRKMIEDRNLFCSYFERYIGFGRETILTDLNFTESEIDKFQLKYMKGMKQIRDFSNIKNMDKEKFNEFVKILFNPIMHYTYDKTFCRFISMLFNAVYANLLTNTIGRCGLSSDTLVTNESVIFYKNNSSDPENNFEVIFTFEKLYNMIVNLNQPDNSNVKNDSSSFAFDSEPMNTDSKAYKLIFPLETKGECTPMENFFIIMEKMVYRVFKDRYTIKKMDNIHRSFFKRKSSVRYLFSRKSSVEMKDEYIDNWFVALLIDGCNDGDMLIKDFINDVLFILASSVSDKYGSLEEMMKYHEISVEDKIQDENIIEIILKDKIENNNIGFVHRIPLTVDEIQEIVNDILSK